MKITYSHLHFNLLFFMMTFVAAVNGQSDSKVIEKELAGLELSERINKIDALSSLCHEYGKFNGSILVADEGKIIYKKGFGWANVEWDVPNQPDTKHRLASITKQFTSMLIMQLVSENKLALNEPISSYQSEYPSEKGDKITIHHMLTHTSGIPNYTSFPNYWEVMRNPMSPSELGLDGYEDLRFLKGWNKPDSEVFWSYGFAWVLDEKPQISASILSAYLNHYFDGLMGLAEKEENEKTKSTFSPTSNAVNSFTGTIETVDGFFTQKPLKFNAQIKASYCDDLQKHIILFHLSPKDFDEGVWTELKRIQTICK